MFWFQFKAFYRSRRDSVLHTKLNTILFYQRITGALESKTIWIRNSKLWLMCVLALLLLLQTLFETENDEITSMDLSKWCCAWLHFLYWAYCLVVIMNYHDCGMNRDEKKKKWNAIQAHSLTIWTSRSKLRLLKSRKICKHLIK